MKSLSSWGTSLGALLVAAGALSPGAAFPETKAPEPVRVGVFDSRAVAIAYAASDLNATFLNGLRAEQEEAKARGDQERVAEIEARGRALQARMHKQGFSTAPVYDILAKVSGKLPGVAEQAGVDLIVSKWEVAYQRPGIELVDVTEPLVRLFDPDDRALRNIAQLKGREPLPLYEYDWAVFEESH